MQRDNLWISAGALFVACLCALFSAAAQNSDPSVANSPIGSAADGASAANTDAAGALTRSGGRIDGHLAGGRWREGTKLVDVQGQFRLSNERITFVSVDAKTRFTCLENLNSERVGRIVAESPETLDWIVQGTITEFRGENYLLLSQTVIRSPGIRRVRTPLPRAKEL